MYIPKKINDIWFIIMGPQTKVFLPKILGRSVFLPKISGRPVFLPKNFRKKH